MILRPGLIVGPYDPTGRFAYWPTRVAEGGDVLCPRPAEQPVQVIDARDLAAFALDLLERGGPARSTSSARRGTLTFGRVIEACIRPPAASPRRCGSTRGSCSSATSSRWSELPLWTPGDQISGFQRSDVSRALAAGFRCGRSLETVRDTLAWCATAGPQGAAR